MADDLRDKLKKQQTRSYLNKDFDGFKSDLLLYAKTYFGEQIQDFSEASVGGLFLDMAAYVGDVMSYYLDHQLSELNVETAVETKNLEKITIKNISQVCLVDQEHTLILQNLFLEL